jgi:ribonucleoside-triphosphate reductase
LPLKTSGGKAPGHLPLKFAIENVREVFDGAVGRHLRPVEAHDCLCHLIYTLKLYY